MSKELADILRASIRRCGMSQNELAKLAGVPQQRLNAFMNGGDMKLRSAGKIAKVLGLTLKKSKS
jgi:plasmid maintenance system antidote protein VapI